MERRDFMEGNRWDYVVRCNAHVIVSDQRPDGMHINQVSVTGNILKDAVFESTTSGKPFLRLIVRVAREATQVNAVYSNRVGDDQSIDLDKLTARERSTLIDDLPVVFHGDLSRVAIRYAAKGAQVHITGWMESRTYFCRKTRRQRRVVELNVTRWVPGPGCNHPVGDAYVASFRNLHPDLSLEELGLGDRDSVVFGQAVEV